LIERLDETEAFAARDCLIIASPKITHALAGDHLKKSLPCGLLGKSCHFRGAELELAQEVSSQVAPAANGPQFT
jgi:hypothetical protein